MDTSDLPRKQQDTEWKAWRQVCKQLEAVGLDVNTVKSDPLIRAMRLWGEALHALRKAIPQGDEVLLEDARALYEPHRIPED